MSIVKRALSLASRALIVLNNRRHIFYPLGDRCYLKVLYRLNFGKKLDLKNPKTFSEKQQWMKLYDRNPLYPRVVDKVDVKDYVAEEIGAEYVIPTLGVWDSFDAIDFDALPDQFVLKCSHDSGGIAICRDKSTFDFTRVKAKLEASLKTSYYRKGREWPYREVKPRILAETYMSDFGDDLLDYKIHCFNGEPKVVLVCSDRFAPTGMREDFYDLDWNLLPVRRPDHPNADVRAARPANLDKMLELARKLAKDAPFMRVDLYNVEGRIYFGELTLFPASGMKRFVPDEWDRRFGDWITLPTTK